MSQTSRFILGGRPLPLDLHTLWVDEHGQPLHVGSGPIQFDFTYRDIRFAGRYEEGDKLARLKLVGDAGPLPFTAESPAARAGLARIVEAANEALGPVFRIVQGRILLGTELSVPTPVTATSLVGAVAELLLPAAPYLELIALYVRPPLAPHKPGEGSLRPEWRRRGPGR